MSTLFQHLWGFSSVQNSRARYKMCRCDFRDHVWTLFPLKDRKTKEKCTTPPGVVVLYVLSRARAHSLQPPLCGSVRRLLSTHLVKVCREISTEISGLGPREKFNVCLACASCSANENTTIPRSYSLWIRRHKARNISSSGNDKSWNWRADETIREIIIFRTESMRVWNVSSSFYWVIFFSRSRLFCQISIKQYFFPTREANDKNKLKNCDKIDN